MSDKYGEGINGLDKEVSNAQCDQIRLFLKGLGDECSHTSSSNIWQLLGRFEKRYL